MKILLITILAVYILQVLTASLLFIIQAFFYDEELYEDEHFFKTKKELKQSFIPFMFVKQFILFIKKSINELD